MSQEPPKLQRFGVGPRNLFRQDPQTGEWQRVLHGGNRKGFLVDQRPREQRRQEELEGRRDRQTEITKYVVALVVSAVLLVWGWSWVMEQRAQGIATPNGHLNSDISFGLFAIFGFFGLLFVLAMAWGLLKAIGSELVYRAGVQHGVKGAKVLDPEPVRPGREVAEQQKVHGSSRLATEAETRTAATGGARRSKVHDQEF